MIGAIQKNFFAEPLALLILNDLEIDRAIISEGRYLEGKITNCQVFIVALYFEMLQFIYSLLQAYL